MRKDSVIQIVVALFAVLRLYPRMGNTIILLMAPMVVYMVFKQSVEYLPALMIHCASETSIMYAILVSMMVVCFLKTSVLLRNKHTRFVYIALVLTLPIYGILTFQRYSLDGDTWQHALAYSSYYLSFWAFIYCFVISHTFNTQTAKGIVYSLVGFALLCILFKVFDKKVLFVSVIIGIIVGVVYLLSTRKKSLEIILGFSLLALFMSFSGLTFTILFTLVYAFFIAFLFISNRKKTLKMSTGIITYLFILLLMILGVTNYTTASYGSYSDKIEFTDWGQFINRIQFKLFEDRSPFWEAGWLQLLEYHPWFPVHNIPNIVAYRSNGLMFDDITFGAHNTPLQLLRLFGFIMGGALIVCYVISTTTGAKFFSSNNKDVYSVALFSVSLSYSVVLFLTGTASMLPSMALFSFGLLGIAYGISEREQCLI